LGTYFVILIPNKHFCICWIFSPKFTHPITLAHIAQYLWNGNRTVWAKKNQREKPRNNFENQSNQKVVKKVVTKKIKLETNPGWNLEILKYLTLFNLFPTRKPGIRPAKKEVDALMSLLVETLKELVNDLMKQNIQLNAIGDLTKLPEKTYQTIMEVINQTGKNTGMVLNIALNYGGRDEIVNMTREIAKN